MNKKELETFLHQHIPVTGYMQVSVKLLEDDRIELAAPLGLNSNHHGTAFGGSISSLAILCGWSWLHVTTLKAGTQCNLVVQKTEMRYLKAIDRNFHARCTAPTKTDWQRFTHALNTRQRGRISLEIIVYQDDEAAAELTAVYAAKVAGNFRT